MEDVDVAVRSSVTAEDLPEACFGGQHETYLNVNGVEAVLQACKDCYGSLSPSGPCTTAPSTVLRH